MDYPFLERLAVSFVVGGASVALFTTAAERFGSRYGGLLLSFPVKLAVSLALLALQEGVVEAAVSASVVPLGIASNVVFLAVTVVALRRIPRVQAIALGMSAWLSTAVLCLLVVPEAAAPAFLVYSGITAAALAGLTAIPALRGIHHRKGARVFSGWRLVRRGLAAGALVASTLIVARLAGPVVAGLFAVFPSAWLTTMIVLSRDQGPDFTGATARTMIAGSASPVAYGLAMAMLLSPLGVLAATLASLVVAVGVSGAAAAALHALDRRLLPPPVTPAPQAAAPSLTR
ncbi:MAG TPA: DUF3147 family protein [Candidatus Thermoplasmatota archaeon]|nr:DUF3147 family protein [Candidatus Thermoplasmatota archaeon]